ncbi:MAG: MlaD family protein [Acidobacteriota bacterium]
MPREGGRETRVGLLLLAALAILAVAVFLIGKDSNLFATKNRYFTRFQNVSGLQKGNPVQLNGVDVGTVEEVNLSREAGDEKIQVWISIDERYAERIRQDSLARIKTLGLLGDKFVEITAGSPAAELVASGAEIRAAPATSVDALIASGEDTVNNVVAISSSLRTVLKRLEQGEGVVGELTADTPEGDKFTRSVYDTVESFQRIVNKLERGDGPIARLINDRAMADRLAESVTSLEGLLKRAEEGDGLLPRLLDDETLVRQVEGTLANLQEASEQLTAFTREVEGSDGLAMKLLTDEEYATEVSENLSQLVERLNGIAGKLSEGDGTVARLIDDPQVYEAINDVIVGIDESRLLRWLIRNRQKKGIEQRFEENQGEDSPNQGGSATP